MRHLILATILSSMSGLCSSPAEIPHTQLSAPSTTLFETVNLADSGIDFRHNWQPPKKYESMIDRSFAGGGVATGDYNNDGKTDILFTRPFGGIQLYKNLGGFRFTNTTQESGLAQDAFWGAGATFVDIDGDDDLDIFICGFDTPNRMFINDGKGHFRDQAKGLGLDFTGSSVNVTFADYDHDGDLDIYLLTNRSHKAHAISGSDENHKRNISQRLGRSKDGKPLVPEEFRESYSALLNPNRVAVIVHAGQYDHLYRNEGSGKPFTDVTREAGLLDNGMGLSATWWDYNNDGWADLYVANDFFGQDRLYKNNGNGTFTDVAAEALPFMPWFSMGSDVADINNDGLLDLMATDMAGTSHYKSKMGMGDMADQAWFLDSANPKQYMRNCMFVNSGTGRFLETAYFSGVSNSDWTWAVKFADFDCDGFTDIFITNGMTGDWMNGDLVSAAKKKDGVVHKAPLKKDQNLAFKNDGSLHFTNQSKAWGLDLEEVSFGASYADLDGDGDLDLIVNNFDALPSIYRNNQQNRNQISFRLKAHGSNTWGLGSLVRLHTSSGIQTRYLTSSHGFNGADAPLLHFAMTKDTASQPFHLEIVWPTGNRQSIQDLKIGNLYTIEEGESQPKLQKLKPPLFVSNSVIKGTPHSEQSYDDFKRQPLLPYKHSNLGPGMAWGDIDGDGDQDFVVGGACGSETRVYMDHGNKHTSPVRFMTNQFLSDVESEVLGCLLIDVDGDKDLDLYTASGSVEKPLGDPAYRDRLYLNDGEGSFSPAPPNDIPNISTSSGTVSAADFDHDGDLDLLVGERVIPGKYPAKASARLLQNNNGVFSDVTATKVPSLTGIGLVTSALWSDIDHDGWVDLLITLEWDSIRIFKNNQGKLNEVTQDSGVAHLKGWWNSIAGRDLDHDGDIDYVVTNAGTNTKYKSPDLKKQLHIYYGDMDGSGSPRIVEAKDQKDRSRPLPVRGRS
jgi:hypothetical protein